MTEIVSPTHNPTGTVSYYTYRKDTPTWEDVQGSIQAVISTVQMSVPDDDHRKRGLVHLEKALAFFQRSMSPEDD